LTPDVMVQDFALAEAVHGNGKGYGPENGQAAVLTSWKDIARYMGKGVRTVQRWEQDFGLPVRRPYGSNKKAIIARPRDLDAWVAMRCKSRAALQIPTGGVDPRAGQIGTRLVALNASVATARMLQKDNRVLMQEFHCALRQLRESIISIKSGQPVDFRPGRSGPSQPRWVRAS